MNENVRLQTERRLSESFQTPNNTFSRVSRVVSNPECGSCKVLSKQRLESNLSYIREIGCLKQMLKDKENILKTFTQTFPSEKDDISVINVPLKKRIKNFFSRHFKLVSWKNYAMKKKQAGILMDRLMIIVDHLWECHHRLAEEYARLYSGPVELQQQIKQKVMMDVYYPSRPGKYEEFLKTPV